MKIIGNTVGTTMPKPNLMQTDPTKGDFVKGKEAISKKLDAEKLPEAINTALAQAKASGEFDGKDGETPIIHPLTFKGAVNATYDGSEAVEVEIPQGGGGSGGGKAKTEKLIDVTLTEATASLSVTLEHNFHKLLFICSCGGNPRLVDVDGNATSGYIAVCINSTAFSWNARKVAVIDDTKKTWATSTALMEWSDDCSVFLRTVTTEVATGVNSTILTRFGGTTAMFGTLGTDDNAPKIGTTVNIITSSPLFAPGCRIVLVGEYYE